MHEKENAKKIRFQRDLLRWWTKYKRDFPWRKTRNPYKLLVAEILLKKTTANQVLTVYSKLLNKYSNPSALCSANRKDLETLLKPLGMYKSKTKLLRKFASAYLSLLKNNKKSKFSRSELLKLPGVGDYTANAVLSLIYNECVPMLDTNFIRILERVFGVKSNKNRPRNDPYIWEKAKEIIPCSEARNFNLAVLDFAALICKQTLPKCNECFAKEYCSNARYKVDP
ncbi:MAG: hypothetical protein GWP10_20245 [Nitrospiraceae bacterium]|nr:hypothetical protein [Nitrospiraceae bacterium]